VTGHETSQMDMMCIALAEPPLVLCRGGDRCGSRSTICNCACKEFKPYRTIEVAVEAIADRVTEESR
jgi:hypothetical protein